MSIRDAVNGFILGLSKGPLIPVSSTQAQNIPVTPPVGNVPVVNTLQPPSNSNIPRAWSSVFMGPGQSFVAIAGESTSRDIDAEREPRTMQYLPNINSTIQPRIAWGLTPFTQLRFFAENVPEVAMCVRLLTEELKSFIPSIVDDSDTEVELPELQWMTERPDRVNPWPVWLSRFLYNVLVYDAPAVYKERASLDSAIRKSKTVLRRTELNPDGSLAWYCHKCGSKNVWKRAAGLSEVEDYHPACANCWTPAPDGALQKMGLYDYPGDLEKEYNLPPITALRIIDGSTLFTLVDERGEQPEPPAPAFTQVIWGVPRMYLNTYQVWYRPRHLRADAPYGRSFIEDSMPAVELLAKLWDYEKQKYIIGNIPEMVFTAPPDWEDAETILDYESAFNARMSGSNQERVRARFLPAGMVALQTKELTFNRESYDAATNAVRMAAGIPQSEVGEAPGEGLGGKGFAEAMQSTFYRMGIAPLQTFIEGLFNDILKENGYGHLKYKLNFPSESIDPEKEEEKHARRFQLGGTYRDEYRAALGLDPLGGEEGKFLATPGGGGEGDQQGNPFGGAGLGVKKPGQPLDVTEHKPVSVIDRKPIDVIKVIPNPTATAAAQAGIDIAGHDIDPNELAAGVQEEMEHIETVNGNLATVVQIALDHLSEDPQYYSHLQTLMKHCGVCAEDDAYFGAAVTQKTTVPMPKQGANESLIVSIGEQNQEPRPAVWKPESGESPKLQDWVGGTLYCRAEAAYLLDRELAPNKDCYLVPVSYVTEVNGEEGSIQHYVRGKQPKQPIDSYDQTWVEQAAVLDYIMGQLDRVKKNYLTHPDDSHRPILIDNDQSFPIDAKAPRSDFIEAYRGKPLSEATLNNLYRLVNNTALWSDLEETLHDQEAMQHAKERAEMLLNDKRIPDASLGKAWEESKHDRKADGKFAPKGAGEEGKQDKPDTGKKGGDSKPSNIQTSDQDEGEAPQPFTSLNDIKLYTDGLDPKARKEFIDGFEDYKIQNDLPDHRNAYIEYANAKTGRVKAKTPDLPQRTFENEQEAIAWLKDPTNVAQAHNLIAAHDTWADTAEDFKEIQQWMVEDYSHQERQRQQQETNPIYQRTVKEHTIRDGTITDKYQLTGNQKGINESYIIAVQDNGRAIYKPDSKKGYGQPKNEVITYDLATALNFTCVPVTTYRDERSASAQEYKENATVGAKLSKNMPPAPANQRTVDTFSQMAILDCMTGNIDRHEGNWLYDNQTAEIHAIDNGFTFLDLDYEINIKLPDPTIDMQNRINDALEWNKHNWEIIKYANGKKNTTLPKYFPVNPQQLKTAQEFVESGGVAKLYREHFPDASEKAVELAQYTAREGLKLLQERNDQDSKDEE